MSYFYRPFFQTLASAEVWFKWVTNKYQNRPFVRNLVKLIHGHRCSKSSFPLHHQACTRSRGFSPHCILFVFSNDCLHCPLFQTDCVFMTKSDGKWRDDSCDNERGYICQMNSREFRLTQSPKQIEYLSYIRTI